MRRSMLTKSVLMLVASLAPLTLVAQTMAEKKAMTDKEPAIGGYCPVAYVLAGKALKGDKRHASDHDGRRYLFVSADAKKMFDDSPARFAVAYEGWCATALASGKKVASDPRIFTVHNGVTYLFSVRDAKTTFDGDKSGHVRKADEHWKKLM